MTFSHSKTEKLSGKANFNVLQQAIIVTSNHSTVPSCIQLLHAHPIPKAQCAALVFFHLSSQWKLKISLIQPYKHFIQEYILRSRLEKNPVVQCAENPLQRRMLKKHIAYYMYIFSRNTEIIKLFHLVFKGQIKTCVV